MKTWNSNANTVRTFGLVAAGLASSLATSAALAGGASTWSQIAGYHSKSDSAFAVDALIVDDFEGARTVGLSFQPAAVVDNGNSVDADDQSIDGNGALGKSLPLGAWGPVFDPAFSQITFIAKQLGGQPTQAGFVITDTSGLGAAAPVTVTVYFIDGSSESRVFDVLSNANDASDDTFIGVENAAGIDSIAISSIIPIYIDHVQCNAPAQAAAAFVRDDFNLDGKSDVAWFSPSSRKSTIWTMDGLTRASGGYTSADPGANAKSSGLGDLDGDRHADMIWRDLSTGRFSAWLMNGNSVISQGFISGSLEASWDIIAIGDLNGDRKADCVLRNSATGEVRGWLMNGLTKTAGGNIGDSAGLKFLGIGDLNADGKQDMLWQNSGGNVIGWIMDGLTITFSGYVGNACSPAPNWKVVGMTDLDGDNHADVIWQDSNTGIVTGWLMNGVRRVSGNYISTSVGADWQIVGTPDLNGDGRGDMIWRSKTTGDVYGWLMNGLTKQSGSFIRGVQSSWQVLR